MTFLAVFLCRLLHVDFAVEHGISHGGWFPRLRRAEDGPIDPR